MVAGTETGHGNRNWIWKLDRKRKSELEAGTGTGTGNMNCKLELETEFASFQRRRDAVLVICIVCNGVIESSTARATADEPLNIIRFDNRRIGIYPKHWSSERVQIAFAAKFSSVLYGRASLHSRIHEWVTQCQLGKTSIFPE